MTYCSAARIFSNNGPCRLTRSLFNGISCYVTNNLPKCISSHGFDISFSRFISTSCTLRKPNENSTEFQTLLLSQPAKHITHVEFDRPKVKNAFSAQTAEEFVNVLESLEANPTVRCLLLSGTGRDFTSGVDIKSFMGVYAQLQETDDVGRKAKLLHNIIRKFQNPFKKMYSFSKPIICVTHGLCYGLGIELAACSDIRYCSEDSRMSIREVLIGIAADVGSLQEMPRVAANQSLLRELIYTGREMTTQEALTLGFVSKVFSSKEEAIEAATETAKLIAARSPVAVQGSKQNLHFSRDKPFLVGMDYNAVWNMSMMQSQDVVKAITAIMSKTDEIDFDDY